MFALLVLLGIPSHKFGKRNANALYLGIGPLFRVYGIDATNVFPHAIRVHDRLTSDIAKPQYLARIFLFELGVYAICWTIVAFLLVGRALF